MNNSEILHFAETIAKSAGQRMQQASGTSLEINESHHHDLKIQLDIDIQKSIETSILEKFPDHHILGEEGGDGSGGKGHEWIIDPIDGTVNLVYGIPHFCCSIAYRVNGETQVGVIYDPMRDESFTAEKSKGAHLNGTPIKASSRTSLNEAILSLGFAKSEHSIERCLQRYQHYGRKARKIRAMGSAALDMVYIASGRIDGYIESDIKIWDIAAGQLILEEAGGSVHLIKREKPHHFSIMAWNGKVPLEPMF